MSRHTIKDAGARRWIEPLTDPAGQQILEALVVEQALADPARPVESAAMS
jgi:hypothetical protein